MTVGKPAPRAVPALDPLPARPSPNQAIGREIAAQHGWEGKEWRCALTLFAHESRWDNFAQNPTSTAFGIGQFLNQTWKGYGPKTTDARLQVTYAMAYVADRYGTPCRAWAKWNERKRRTGNAWY